MPKLQLSTQSIAYRESAGTDQPHFLLIHGNSSSSRSYQRLFDTELGQSHRMVALDLPGHGDSDAAPDPAATYTLPGYASIVAEAAQALNMTDAIVVGWSLGGHIALEAVAHFPEAKGFVIFGTPPIAFPPAMDEAFLPNPNMGSSFAAELSEAQMRAYVTEFFKAGTAFPDSFIEDIRKTDGTARATMGASIQPDGYTDEVEIVGSMTQALMVIHGEQEALVSGDYIKGLTMPTLWRGEVQMIPDAGHAPHWETPDAFAQLLKDFAADL